MGVSTIKSSGGDYSDAESWWADVDADLTGLGPYIADCYDLLDSSDLIFDSTVTTASDYAEIRAAGSGVHDGTSRDNSGACYQIQNSASNTATIRIREDYVRITGICVTQNDDQNVIVTQTIGASNDIRITDSIVHKDHSSTETLIYDSTNAIITMENTLVYGNGWGLDFRNGSTSSTINHCGVHTTHTFAYVAQAGISVDNSWGSGGSSNTFWSGGTSTGNNNASTDTSATTQFSSSVASFVAANVFETVETDSTADFHLSAGTNALVAAGASGSSLDYEGDARHPTTPDIGPDERTAYSAGGGSTGSISEAATASATLGAVSGLVSSFVGASTAAATITAVKTTGAAFTAGTTAGDSDSSVFIAPAIFADQAQAADTQAAIAGLLGALNAGVSAGESWATSIIAVCSISESMTASAAFSGVVGGALSGAVSAGTASSAAFVSYVNLLATLTGAATASEAMTAVFTVLAAVAEGATAGETFSAIRGLAATLSVGASASATFSGALGQISGAISMAVDSAATFSATSILSAVLSAGATASATFTTTAEAGYLTASITIESLLTASITIEAALSGSLTLN